MKYRVRAGGGWGEMLDSPAERTLVLGTDEGMALAEKLDLAVLFIERTDEGFSERATPRFEEITSRR